MEKDKKVGDVMIIITIILSLCLVIGSLYIIDNTIEQEEHEEICDAYNVENESFMVRMSEESPPEVKIKAVWYNQKEINKLCR